ncbi:MAG: hypothetical protein OEY79_03665, partial [Anaplasmataceae bacterium]|nr:hypothetical protein [Anaplasmataceae bacterium]
MAKYAKLFQKLITAEVERLSNMIDKTITPLTSKVLPIFYALAITGSVIGVSIAAIGVHKGGIFNLDRRGAIELLVPIVLVLAMLIFLICCRIINKINYDKDKYQEQVVRLEYLQKLTTSDIANDIIFYDKLNALQYNALTVFYALAIIGSGIGVGITAIGVHKGGIFNLDRRGAIELLVPIVLVL